MQNKIRESIIRTLCYSDIFDFPLTAREVFKFYIGKKERQEKIYSTLRIMVENGEIGKHGRYHFLNGKNALYKIRSQREKESKKKMITATRISKILSLIPTVKLIGISGSLSMRNCKIEDDLDLFIISKPNTLWLTRALVSLLLIVSRTKRSRSDTFGIDKICPNMFMSLSSLTLSQNIFLAHELAQLKVLVNRDHAYEKLINKNFWVSRFLPHAFKRIRIDKNSQGNILLSILDGALFKLQYKYMKARITTEKIAIHKAFFHPKDKTNFVTDLYKEKYMNYRNYLSEKEGILSNSSFDFGTSDTPGY